MTYSTMTAWECDVHGCDELAHVAGVSDEPPKGWTSTPDGDFCPKHKENATETEAALG